jgi:hypothetical protein
VILFSKKKEREFINTDYVHSRLNFDMIIFSLNFEMIPTV